MTVERRAVLSGLVVLSGTLRIPAKLRGSAQGCGLVHTGAERVPT